MGSRSYMDVAWLNSGLRRTAPKTASMLEPGRLLLSELNDGQAPLPDLDAMLICRESGEVMRAHFYDEEQEGEHQELVSAVFSMVPARDIWRDLAIRYSQDRSSMAKAVQPSLGGAALSCEGQGPGPPGDCDDDVGDRAGVRVDRTGGDEMTGQYRSRSDPNAPHPRRGHQTAEGSSAEAGRSVGVRAEAKGGVVMSPNDRMADAFMELLGDHAEQLDGKRIGLSISMAISECAEKAGENREAIHDCLREVARELDAAAVIIDERESEDGVRLKVHPLFCPGCARSFRDGDYVEYSDTCRKSGRDCRIFPDQKPSAWQRIKRIIAGRTEK